MNNITEIPIYDLYGLWYKPFWKEPWFLVLLLMLFLIFFAAITFWFVWKRNNIMPTKEYWQEALEQFSALDIDRFLKDEAYAVFYFKLTQVMKKYLSLRYGLPLESKTDEEVITIIRTAEFPLEFFADLSKIFDSAVFIKFAKQNTIHENMKNDLSICINIIKKTYHKI
ncbi:MAG: hypothetical protein WDZ41_06040 [Candidatus Babeliales bacterium]